jgi:hypothetical protein
MTKIYSVPKSRSYSDKCDRRARRRAVQGGSQPVPCAASPAPFCFISRSEVEREENIDEKCGQALI